MSEQFQPGDVVQLKSGGPRMTVTRMVSNGEVAQTAWFAIHTHETAAFPVETLLRVAELAESR